MVDWWLIRIEKVESFFILFSHWLYAFFHLPRKSVLLSYAYMDEAGLLEDFVQWTQDEATPVTSVAFSIRSESIECKDLSNSSTSHSLKRPITESEISIGSKSDFAASEGIVTSPSLFYIQEGRVIQIAFESGVTEIILDLQSGGILDIHFRNGAKYRKEPVRLPGITDFIISASRCKIKIRDWDLDYAT